MICECSFVARSFTEFRHRVAQSFKLSKMEASDTRLEVITIFMDLDRKVITPKIAQEKLRLCLKDRIFHERFVAELLRGSRIWITCSDYMELVTKDFTE